MNSREGGSITIPPNATLRYQFVLFALDVLVVVGSIIISYMLRLALVEQIPLSNVVDRLSWVTAVVVAVHLLALWITGQYRVSARLDVIRLSLIVLAAVLMAYAGMALLFYLYPAETIGRVVFTSHVLLSVVGLTATRLVVRRFVVDPAQGERILVMGPVQPDHPLFEDLERSEVPQCRIVSICEAAPPSGRPRTTGRCHRFVPRGGEGSPQASPEITDARFSSLIEDLAIDRVLVMPGAQIDDEVRREVIERKYDGLAVTGFVSYYSRRSGKLPLEVLDEQWFVLADRTEFFQHQFIMRIKRLIDILFSTSVLILSAPALVMVALAIKISSPRGPVLFRQIRYTTNKAQFELLKFRTMVPDAESPQKTDHVVEGDTRIFFLGKILRKFRIDEIPQLVNILRGEMSLVGPRPTRPEFAAKMREHIPFYDLRFKVKPGVTGLAQVSMRPPQNLAENIEKVAFDMYYVHNASLWLDLRIIFRTIKTVLTRTG